MAVIYGFKVNGTTYEYDYNHLANKPTELPSCDSDDAGKVLTVAGNGNLQWAAFGNGSSSASGAGTASAGLPTYDCGAFGCVLMVNEVGDVTWENPESKWPVLEEYPSAENAENGDVLMCENGSLYWRQPLPPYDSTDGKKALVVSEDGDGLAWSDILPSWSLTDSGKVLTVNTYGELEWLPVSTT